MCQHWRRRAHRHDHRSNLGLVDLRRLYPIAHPSGARGIRGGLRCGALSVRLADGSVPVKQRFIVSSFFATGQCGFCRGGRGYFGSGCGTTTRITLPQRSGRNLALILHLKKLPGRREWRHHGRLARCPVNVVDSKSGIWTLLGRILSHGYRFGRLRLVGLYLFVDGWQIRWDASAALCHILRFFFFRSNGECIWNGFRRHNLCQTDTINIPCTALLGIFAWFSYHPPIALVPERESLGIAPA
mmetsp:Transcript_1705/g.4301  ORF Transcript_1705/g.4301 Transcript_1705/m.4301 type:complete len:243 (-) Transcript_1705:391-1119(-)